MLQNLIVKFIKPFLVSPPIARSSATTPSQRPIVTGITPVDNIMSGGLRNRRPASSSTSGSRPETPTVPAEGTTASVRVSIYLTKSVYLF